jgi:hypothetical protein
MRAAVRTPAALLISTVLAVSALSACSLPGSGDGETDGPRADVGERYPVGDPAGDDPGAWVVVPEGARDVGVEVEYAGETQVVDDPRRGYAGRPTTARRGLYDAPPRLGEDETVERLLGGDRDGLYVVGGGARTRALSPVPYATGLGWAPPGRGWLLVDVHLDGATGGHDPTNGADGYVEYEIDGGEVDVRFEGERPVELLAPGSPRPDTDQVGGDPLATGLEDVWGARAVFSVPEDLRRGDLVVRRPYTVRPEDLDEAVRLGTPAEADRTLRLRRSLVF